MSKCTCIKCKENDAKYNVWYYNWPIYTFMCSACASKAILEESAVAEENVATIKLLSPTLMSEDVMPEGWPELWQEKIDDNKQDFQEREMFRSLRHLLKRIMDSANK